MKEIKIETERLLLRKFEKRDTAKCYINYGQDKELGRYLPMYPMKREEDMALLIEGFVNAYENEAFIWLIEEKMSKEPIGCICVDIPYKELNIGEISYLLGTRYQRKGYALEAVNAVIDYMLNVQNLYMLEAKYNKENIASSKLLTKLNFVQDGELRDRRVNQITHVRCNLIICSLKKNEYTSKFKIRGA
nr:GNAT family N-acetyltransferase [uncultured Cellulosilyticum sp.]